MRAQEFVTEYKKYPTREYEGVTFTMMEKDGQLIVKALNDFGLPMGHVVFGMDGRELDPKDLEVYDKYQGQGIARVMYDYIKSQGFTINRSFDQTDAGRGFWDKHRGEDSYVWEDRGQGAAGIVLYAQDTGRYGLQQRSNEINDPGLWAAWGGGREPGETLEQCARRELGEESGYMGPIKLKRLAENPKYVTFLGIVPHEFEPRANDEWQDYCWVEAGDWPAPMHPGVTAALRNISLNEDTDNSTWLYHATYRPLLKSIRAHGLGGDRAQAKWEDSKPGVVYLARDPDVAESYAESSDVVPDEWLDQIVVLKINASQLDQSRLFVDQNVQDNSGDTLEYHGIIPVASLSLTENFADGKVRGKSRPGRVKRAGASCKGSVSDLRAKARKYGGEKGRMYHWCANMKGGKKK